jgi:acyl-coenzyme A thioesterase PaaI-like protein
MTFSRRGDRVLAEVTLGRPHMGWDRIAHGGVVSTVLDEVMAWAVIALERVYFVTRSMTVTYRRPVPLEVPLVAEGWLLGRDPPRSCTTAARLLDPAGELLAEAKAEMVYLAKDRLGVLSAGLRAEMDELFEAMARLDQEVAQ